MVKQLQTKIAVALCAEKVAINKPDSSPFLVMAAAVATTESITCIDSKFLALNAISMWKPYTVPFLSIPKKSFERQIIAHFDVVDALQLLLPACDLK